MIGYTGLTVVILYGRRHCMLDSQQQDWTLRWAVADSCWIVAPSTVLTAMGHTDSFRRPSSFRRTALPVAAIIMLSIPMIIIHMVAQTVSLYTVGVGTGFSGVQRQMWQ